MKPFNVFRSIYGIQKNLFPSNCPQIPNTGKNLETRLVEKVVVEPTQESLDGIAHVVEEMTPRIIILTPLETKQPPNVVT